MRPYLSERATVLVGQLVSTRIRDYKQVKEYLLHQFRISPRVLMHLLTLLLDRMVKRLYYLLRA